MFAPSVHTVFLWSLIALAKLQAALLKMKAANAYRYGGASVQEMPGTSDENDAAKSFNCIKLSGRQKN